MTELYTCPDGHVICVNAALEIVVPPVVTENGIVLNKLLIGPNMDEIIELLGCGVVGSVLVKSPSPYDTIIGIIMYSFCALSI